MQMGKPMWKVTHIARVAGVVCAVAAVTSAGVAHAAGGLSPQTPAAHTITASARAADGYWTRARMQSAAYATEAGATGKAAGSVIIPSPIHFAGVPTVGALFYTTGTESHFCTASVVDSPHGDIVLTAAHCVYGSSYATNIAYVPEWHDGVSPYGTWTVTSITVAQGWISSHDQDLDFAFLTVEPRSGGQLPVQRVTGGLRLGVDAGSSHKISVIGYNDTDSDPVGCATTSSQFGPAQMQFYCDDYWDGTSGGPWILDFDPVTGGGIVFGDIGGYQQGGDYPYLSYSPYFGSDVFSLFLNAERYS